MNTQLIKGGSALALTMAPSGVTGLSLTEGQWCCATVTAGNVTQGPPSAPYWLGPSGPPAAGPAVPAVGASSTDGSGTLSQPSSGGYTLGFISICNSQSNSQLFMFRSGTLYGSQMFDLVDKAGPAPPRNLSVAIVY